MTVYQIDLKKAFDQIEKVRAAKNLNYIACTIIEVIEEVFKIEPGTVLSKDRTHRATSARQAAVYLVVNLGYTWTEAAKFFDRHHSTLMKSYKTHENDMRFDHFYKERFTSVKNQLPIV